jgi:large subunit ribosomal protein L23
MELEQVIIEPIITEKAVAERKLPRYVFRVDLRATKTMIKQAVEKIFKVKVKAVNTCYVRGKKRMLGRNVGRTAHWKKAYVTLAPGQKIAQLEA